LERVHVARADVAPVVDEDVDASEAIERGRDRRRPVLAARQVELHDQGVDAERTHLARDLLEAPGEGVRERLPHRRGVLQARAAGDRTGGEDEVEAAAGELQRAGAADAPARARDEGDLALRHRGRPTGSPATPSTRAASLGRAAR